MMKLIVCNLKTYLNKEEFDLYINSITDLNLSNVVICPSFIYLDSLYKKNIVIGSQDVSIYKNGNHTGEITPSQLKSLDITYSIVGHSERCEKNDIISIKINNLLEEGINPIFCIGEDIEDRKNNTYKEKIENKLKKVLNYIDNKDISKIIIAYEPLWAIGSGITPTNDELGEILTYIKDVIKEKYNTNIKVLYGGSVNIENISTLNSIEILDGYLIGKASTDPEQLKIIIDKVKNTKKDKN